VAGGLVLRIARVCALGLWLVLLGVCLYAYLFHHDGLLGAAAVASRRSTLSLYGLYLALGCIRGFTLVPATYLLVAGMLILPPGPLYLVTMIGIVVSSTAVYYFAEGMGFAGLFERRYAARTEQLRRLLGRRELPIVIAWSFFPIAPTDLICYICGALRVDVRTCVLGVAIGEGAICGIYVVLGAGVMSWFG
jgi:uncharacterized membrane protein YdjX (TVP38/TMEM64 family)